jgi:hypothetical protein
MLKRKHRFLLFFLILILTILSGCSVKKWNPDDFSTATETGKILRGLARDLRPGKSTLNKIERDLCGSADTLISFPYYDIETRIAMLVQNEEKEPLKPYLCSKIDHISIIYDAGNIMQGVIFSPFLIHLEGKGDVESLPIQDVLDTFGNPSLVYESERNVFFAYPTKGIEIRLATKFDIEDESYDHNSWPEYLPESTYALYVMLFTPMSNEQFRETYMEQYSPYREVDWKGVGKP